MHRDDLSVEVIGKKEQEVLVQPMTNCQWNRTGNHSTPSYKPESGLSVSMNSSWEDQTKLRVGEKGKICFMSSNTFPAVTANLGNMITW